MGASGRGGKEGRDESLLLLYMASVIHAFGAALEHSVISQYGGVRRRIF